MNVYGFLHNSPAIFIDIFGLDSTCPTCGENWPANTICENCNCCCVDKISFEKGEPFSGIDEDEVSSVDPNYRKLAFYKFRAKMDLKHHPTGTDETGGPCRWEWRETSSLPSESIPTLGQSLEASEPDWPTAPTPDTPDPVPHYCGSKCIDKDTTAHTLHDTPGVYLEKKTGDVGEDPSWRKRSSRRKLRILVIAKSAAGCKCTHTQKTLKIECYFRVTSGEPNWEKSYCKKVNWF
jgi:hypothetical protein